jgi:KUP system potassium uptake protein
MQLGYLPRLSVHHTSEETIGQVYVPWVNRLLLVMVIAVVLGFGSSTALASAYGVSVTGTMLITTGLLLIVAQGRWRWPGLLTLAVFLPLFLIDVSFFGANVVKISDGAWFPLALGIVVFTLMRTWRRGRQLLIDVVRRDSMSLDAFVRSSAGSPPLRAPGTAIFMTATNDRVPLALLQNIKHNKVLHERNVLLTVETVQSPRADPEERIALTAVAPGFYQLSIRFGFMEDPNVPRVLRDVSVPELPLDAKHTTYFASRESLVASKHKGMPLWRDKIFMLMARNTVGATVFFRIPGNQLVELGTQVEI